MKCKGRFRSPLCLWINPICKQINANSKGVSYNAKWKTEKLSKEFGKYP